MCTLTDIYFVFGAVILLFLHNCVCDYDCLCNYNVEKAVYGSADAANKPIGYMYEFDCKPLISDADPKWSTVAYEHKVGFVEKNAQIRIQICSGDIPDEDKIITTTTERTTQTVITTVTVLVTQKPSTIQPLPLPTTEMDLTTQQPLTTQPLPIITYVQTVQDTQPSLTSSTSTLSVPQSMTTPNLSVFNTSNTITTTNLSTTHNNLKQNMSTSAAAEIGSMTQTSLITVTTEIPHTGDILDKSRNMTQTPLESGEKTTSPNEMQNWTTEQSKTFSDSSVTILEIATIYPSGLAIDLNSLPPVSTHALDITSSPNILSPVEKRTETKIYNIETTLSTVSSTTIPPTIDETSTPDHNLPYLSTTTITDISSPTTDGTLDNSNGTMLPITLMTVLSNYSVDSQISSSTFEATQSTSQTLTSIDSAVTLINDNITQLSNTSIPIPTEISASHSPLSTLSSTENSMYMTPSTILTSLATSNPQTPTETTPSSKATSKPGTYSDRVDLCPYKYMALSPYNNFTMIYSYFRQYGKYCFELRFGMKNWFEAQSDCRARGGDLAVIPDSETQQRIYEMVKTAVKGYTPDVWIGLNDLRHEGHWEWVDGQQLTQESYSNTAFGYSVYSDIHDCFVMDGKSGCWKNTACRTLLFNIQVHPWVCQYKI